MLAVIVYLHSETQRFFVDVSFKFSNAPCRYTAYGNFAILLSLMQRVMGYLLTLPNFDFLRSFEHKRPITSKSKDVTYTIITLQEAKTLPDFIMSSVLLSKTDIGLNLFFDHNVRNGNSVTLRIGVALESS